MTQAGVAIAADEKAAWAEVEKRATFLADLLGHAAGGEAAKQASDLLVQALAAYRAVLAPKPRAG